MKQVNSILTGDQIGRLYKFCEKHYVRQYDVQTELVDHLATAIEEKMDADKNISFERALEEVYSGFGVMGFAPVVSSSMDKLNKAQVKMKWQLFKHSLTPPKLFATILLPVLAVMLFHSTPAFFKDWGTHILLGIGMIFQVVVIVGTYRLSKTQLKELLITRTFSMGVSLGNSFLLFLNSLHWRSSFEMFFDWWAYLYIGFYYLAMMMILLHYQFIRLVYASAKQQYPEAFA
jgi:hypothetical protein